MMGPLSHQAGFLLGKHLFSKAPHGEAGPGGCSGAGETQSSPHPIARVWSSCCTLHPGDHPPGPSYSQSSCQDQPRRGTNMTGDRLGALLSVGLQQPTSAGPPALYPAPRHPVSGYLCSSPLTGCLHSVHTHATPPSPAPLRPYLYSKGRLQRAGSSSPSFPLADSTAFGASV